MMPLNITRHPAQRGTWRHEEKSCVLACDGNDTPAPTATSRIGSCRVLRETGRQRIAV